MAAPGLSVTGEFVGAVLGDQRLNGRLNTIVGDLEGSPEMSFPHAFENETALEGFYRFVGNDKVTFDAVLDPHIDATVERVSALDVVLAVHDTTEFRFEGQVKREGLGRLSESGQGFHSHVALAVSADGRRDPLGVLGVYSWARKGPTATELRKKKELTYKESRQLATEQARWGELVDQIENRVEDAASLIHVMDSEADDYTLLAKLVHDQQRFVVRLCYDRVLDMQSSGSKRHRKVKAFVASEQPVCTRTVSLSDRARNPGGKRKRTQARKARNATLSFSAKRAVVFRRPSHCGKEVPSTIKVNVVLVRETDPPPDAEPVEWTLITTEPVRTMEQILRIVDYYRGRWRVEEYFKALKTGCAYEKRQLESYKTLHNALAIFIPIAWNLLRLRVLSRTEPSAPASRVLTPLQIKVLTLASNNPPPVRPTVRDALLAVAKLGGHLRSNGDPGWQILGRGYTALLTLERGFKLAFRDASP